MDVPDGLQKPVARDRAVAFPDLDLMTIPQRLEYPGRQRPCDIYLLQDAEEAKREASACRYPPKMRHAALSCLLAALTACAVQTAPVGSVPGREEPPATATAVDAAFEEPVAAPVASERKAPAGQYWEGFADTVSSGLTVAALSRGELDVYPSPGGAVPERTLPATTILGTSTVVTGIWRPVQGRLEVTLPGRPNGSTGWIDIDAVDLYVVTDRIVVDLSDRVLTYHVDGVEVLRADVAIGTGHNPTPTGAFFVTDRVDLADGSGPWGPAALGLSARSETITEFNGGDGIIGIHGTNRPGSIGEAASLGCLRLANDVIVELKEKVSLGTPVEIRA